MAVPNRPLMPHDWLELERLINEIWAILNTETTLGGLEAEVDANTAAIAALDEIAGNDTEVQFNDGGVHGAKATFTFDKATNTLSVTVTQTTRLLAGGVTV